MIPCACANARRSSRLLTQLYDRHLRDTGIEAAQFAMLAVLDQMPGASQATIVRLLDMEKTTLSRNLKLLESKGWIEPSRAADDARKRGFVVTRAGKRLYEAAKPAWNKAQEQLQSAMTAEEWQTMWNAFGAITRAAHAIEENPHEATDTTDRGHRTEPGRAKRSGAGKS